MRITQGCFSFLPDLTDEQIGAQVEYCLRNGWAIGVEYADDPHPRNTLWEMWGNPMFDLRDAACVMMEFNACRKAHGEHSIRINAFDSTRVLFIDEAYYLYRPDNERDYGQEAIEILLQVMENQRDDLVVILAGYADRMDMFFASNPGFRSRIAHHVDFPDYSNEELLAIAETLLKRQNYHFDEPARAAMRTYISARRAQPHFANARSIRNALDRARLRQANRLFEAATGPVNAEVLSTITAADILASRVFAEPSQGAT